MGRLQTNDTCCIRKEKERAASLGMNIFSSDPRWQQLASSQWVAKGDGNEQASGVSVCSVH